MPTPSGPRPGPPAPAPDDQGRLRDALKRAAVALKQGDLRFALAGGFAAWSHGAPEPDHDADLVIVEDDAPRARELLREAGFEVVEPAEDWLFKAFRDQAMIDVLFRVCGEPVTAELLGRASLRDVLSVHMPVLPATDVLAAKLLALTEQTCDFSGLLPVARALREQVDWPDLHHRVEGNDYAAAFLHLLGRLRVVPPQRA